MHAVLQESISGVYADLVTRPTGRVVRERIERAIAGGSVVEITVARIDFTGVGCIDYSCADEIVAKMLRGGFPDRDSPASRLHRRLPQITSKTVGSTQSRSVRSISAADTSHTRTCRNDR